MAARNGIINLQDFLHKYFFKRGVDEGEMHRYAVIACDGLRDLHIHHLPIMNTTTLSIDTTNYTADYPDDYVDYVFVAIEDTDTGKWWVFTRDNMMVDKTVSGVTGSDLGDYVSSGGYGAVGGKNQFYFQPNNKERRFQFDEAYSSYTVVLKYKSTGVSVVNGDSETDIQFPVYAEESLENYISWQVSEFDGASQSECERKERLYTNAVKRMRNIGLPSAREILEVWLGSSNVTGVIRS